MKNYNDDNPIQDMTPFRWGLDNLEDNSGVNADYSEDMHHCSNDLSEKGSIREEREHAEFARRKKEELLNRTNYNYKWQTSSTSNTFKNSTMQKGKNTGVAIVIFIIIYMFIGIMEIVGSIADEFSYLTENSETVYEDYDNYDYYNDYENYNDINSMDGILNTQNEDEIIEDVLIETAMSEYNTMYLTVANTSGKTLNDIDLTVKFYDKDGTQISTTLTSINTLFANSAHISEVLSVPDKYERFEVIPTQLYDIPRDNIEYSDIGFEVSINTKGEYWATITNNSDKQINILELVTIAYKNDEIVGIDYHSVSGIQPGEELQEEISNIKTLPECNDVRFMINDVYVY